MSYSTRVPLSTALLTVNKATSWPSLHPTPSIIPSERTIRSGSYPLLVPIYFYWDNNEVNPSIEKFVDYCRKKGLGG